MTSLPAGIVYFAVVFAAGIALGTARVLVVVPAGETAAVLIELPIILALSWMVCGWLIARLKPRGSGLVMGGVAFALLMVAEFALARFGFGQSASVYLAHFATVPGIAGLLGQIAFAVIPVLRLRR